MLSRFRLTPEAQQHDETGGHPLWPASNHMEC